MGVRAKSDEIKAKVLEYIISREKYDLLDMTKIRLGAGIKTDMSVALALYKLDTENKLQEYVVIKKLGGRKIYVRK